MVRDLAAQHSVYSCNHLHFVSYWIQLNTLVVLQTRAFSRWLARFADGQIQMRLIARIRQAETGNLGDWKQIDATISELRLHFGSGYRIYFTRRERNVVLLLVGGDKASQQRDIQKGDIQKARRIAATLIELP